MNQNLIGIKAMAKKLDVPESWLYSRTRTNEIPHYKLGKYVKFDESEVMEWIRIQNEAE
jgi:excisionase family DNA binding protein